MIPAKVKWTDFSVSEWNRLQTLAQKHDAQLKKAFLETVVQGNQANSLITRNVITDCVVETGFSTADAYRMVFNPNSFSYRLLIDRLTDSYMSRVVNDENAKKQVKAILPSGLPLAERRNRLDTFGLDGRSAVRIERMRQDGKSEQDIHVARLNSIVQRGNILAATEINRVINLTNETLWIDNLSVSKSQEFGSNWFFDVGVNVSNIARLPKRARKEIITRRDDRVCDYCFPLDGVKAKIGEEFETGYGFFLSPPFHPRCFCYVIISI